MEIERNIIQKYFGEKVLQFEFIGSGWHNNLYLLNKKYVARLSFTEHGKNKMKIYNEIFPLINLEINIPQYFNFNILSESKYTAIVFYPYFNGSITKIEKLNNNSILLLSKTIYDIHNQNFENFFEIPNLKNEIEIHYKNIREKLFSCITKSEREFIDSFYLKYINSTSIEKIKPKFIHGDLTGKNIIQLNNNLISLIDWDGMHYNDPIYSFHSFPIDCFYKLLSGYPNIKELGDNILFRYMFYKIHINILNLYYCMESELYHKVWDRKYLKVKEDIKHFKYFYKLI